MWQAARLATYGRRSSSGSPDMKTRLLLTLLVFALSGCNTIGFGRNEAGFSTISPQVAYTMLQDSREVVVVDVRSWQAFATPPGHIAGAISAPLDSIERRLPELLPYVRDTVLVYGATPEESERAAGLFVAAGFRSVSVIEGGLDRWIELRFPTVSSG